MELIETAVFTRQAGVELTDAEYRALQLALIATPTPATSFPALADFESSAGGPKAGGSGEERE